MSDLQNQFALVQTASRTVQQIPHEKVDQILHDLADHIVANTEKILAANTLDLARMDESNPKYDRLLLNADRIKDIAAEMKNVANLPSPLGRILDERAMESGLHLTKISVPLGVIGIIYEARPNVTFDVFSLCFKSGNACILKGGSDAKDSNKAATELIQEVLTKHGVTTDAVFLMPPEREHVKTLLEAKEFVDIIIPRGSQGLIDFVTANSKVPTIETGAGIVHTYIHSDADLEMAKAIIINAKTRRVSVCNALDCLIIHESHLQDLPDLTAQLAEENVQIFADEKSFAALNDKYKNLEPATDQHFGTEFLSLKMSIKTVANLDEAIAHITKYSSKHSEAIITEDQTVADKFLTQVDAAAVYHNTSTAFTDGAQFGLGAEIGISTQKLHARGPMSLAELTSYKWLVSSKGVVRQ
jgi:glutamate-5-semialdehyde dehydrogenase